MEIWNKNKLFNNINLSNKTKISIENENILNLNNNSFKTTKLEAVKWYNIITRVMFLD